MRVFKNAWFRKFARKEGLSDKSLCEAGLIDADLGGGVIKQRVARSGGGKSGGYRTLILFRAQTRAVFAFGFAKSDRANLSAEEEAVFRRAAKIVLALMDDEIDVETARGRLSEVRCHDEDLQK